MQRRMVIGGVLGLAMAGRVRAARAALPADLAPTGRLRAAINYGNAALARRDPASGELSGVSVDIARELGRRTGLPLDLVPFDAAGKVSAAAAGGVWDVAFWRATRSGPATSTLPPPMW